MAHILLVIVFVAGCAAPQAPPGEGDEPPSSSDDDDDDDSAAAIDDDDSAVASPDNDGDGFSLADGDCDDEDPLINPGRGEWVCDGVDNDCDPATSDLVDIDDDGFFCDSDCWDSNAAVHPGADEVCDGWDTDCDPATDVAGGEEDQDGDGSPVCAPDCDDEDPTAYPGALEACDGVDNDCDPSTAAPGGEGDADQDGVPACGDCDDEDPDSMSVAVDADCDGLADPFSVSGISFLSVQPGEFEMGCANDYISECWSDETPRHTVTLTQAFWLMEFELTDGQWDQVFPENPSFFDDCGTDCPVDSIHFWAAMAYANELSALAGLPECYSLSGCVNDPGEANYFCNNVQVLTPSENPLDCDGFRLPIEAEWEYAARAGTELRWAGSDDWEDVAWFGTGLLAGKQPVGLLQPNGWGFYDMNGNLWESVWDPWDPSGSGYYDPSLSLDPIPAISSNFRLWRGGGWGNVGSGTTVYAREGIHANSANSNTGIRLARTVP